MSKHANTAHKEHKNDGENDEKMVEAIKSEVVSNSESADSVDSTVCIDIKAELEARIVTLEAKVKAVEDENSSLKDQYLRKVADFENFRKRMFKEKEDALKYANTNILVDLIGIIDNFDRAVQSAEQGKDFQNLHDGIVMLQKQFLSMLESKYALKRFDSQGEEFDPHRHEALMSEEKEGIPHAIVAEDFMKGYLLHERVVRTSKVKVAMPKKPDVQSDQPEVSENIAEE